MSPPKPSGYHSFKLTGTSICRSGSARNVATISIPEPRLPRFSCVLSTRPVACSTHSKPFVKTSGQVQLLKDLDVDLEGRDVVIVEDIVDTGLTLTYLQDILRARSPRNLRTACLLSKPSRRKVDVQVDYVGFTIEDKFVVGYGLDYAEQHRNLPYIAVIGD